MTQLSYTKIALTAILFFQRVLKFLNLQILHFLVKNFKCEHLGHKGCCFYTLTCYGYVYEGYASYGFCFDNNEKYLSLILDLNHLKLTSHGILHYQWLQGLSKCFSQLIMTIFIFSQYFFQQIFNRMSFQQKSVGSPNIALYRDSLTLMF